MIDLEDVKRRTDLLSICGADTDFRKVASSGGGEWAGPCPFCGGRDRFRVQPHQFRWLCRNCSDGKWQDVIEYIARRDHLNPHHYNDLREICQRAVGTVQTIAQPIPRKVWQEPDPRPPSLDWQTAARDLIHGAIQTLWSPRGAPGLDYLRARGLTDQTIHKWQLGYIPIDTFESVKKRGLSNEVVQEQQKVWIPTGISIPCFIQGNIWYVKFRRFGQEPKYINLKGGHPGLFGADQLAWSSVALLCEGEFDAILANQELEGEITACTFGSASYRSGLTYWTRYFQPLCRILSVYDQDDAGRKGSLALQNLGFPVTPLQLPNLQGAKDITDYFLKGGDLYAWLKRSTEEMIEIWPSIQGSEQLQEKPPYYVGKSTLDNTSHRLNRGVK